ncbi:MAG: hypothetical protein BWY99_02908 [Synergistetes bacterium ADurb.BinA166]|nr:MAG: hypothetical protein BWY99_02908 [Synergistetes bacterium ADurb.BinA166]
MRLFLENRVQAAVSLLIPAEMDEGGAALLQDGDIAGIDLEDMLKVLLRLRIPPEVEQRNPPEAQDDLV